MDFRPSYVWYQTLQIREMSFATLPTDITEKINKMVDTLHQADHTTNFMPTLELVKHKVNFNFGVDEDEPSFVGFIFPSPARSLVDEFAFAGELAEEFAEEFAEQYAEEHGVEFSSKPKDCIYVTEAVFKQIVAYMAKDDPEQAEEILEDMPDLKMPNGLYKLDGYMETEIVD